MTEQNSNRRGFRWRSSLEETHLIAIRLNIFDFDQIYSEITPHGRHGRACRPAALRFTAIAALARANHRERPHNRGQQPPPAMRMFSGRRLGCDELFRQAGVFPLKYL
jgi:hypothetical protein